MQLALLKNPGFDLVELRRQRRREWHKKLYRKRWRQANLNYSKRYSKEHPEKMKLYRKRWRQKNSNYIKRYSQEHSEKIALHGKRWRQANGAKVLAYRRRYNQKNRKKIREYFTSPEYRTRRNERYRQRIETDPKFHLDRNIGIAIYEALKGKKAGRKWQSLVNYSLEELKAHLEKKFDSKMDWDNYGSYWHMDHIRPKDSFKYLFPEDPEFQKCWALENLQPLEAIENIKKSNKF